MSAPLGFCEASIPTIVFQRESSWENVQEEYEKYRKT